MTASAWPTVSMWLAARVVSPSWQPFISSATVAAQARMLGREGSESVD